MELLRKNNIVVPAVLTLIILLVATEVGPVLVSATTCLVPNEDYLKVCTDDNDCAISCIGKKCPEGGYCALIGCVCDCPTCSFPLP
ncbi:unnamed protein product [Urochloa humidicola]